MKREKTLKFWKPESRQISGKCLNRMRKLSQKAKMQSDFIAELPKRIRNWSDAT